MRGAYVLYRSIGGQREQAQALLDLGQLDGLLENYDLAKVNFTHARAGFGRIGDRAGEATSMRAILHSRFAILVFPTR